MYVFIGLNLSCTSTLQPLHCLLQAARDHHLEERRRLQQEADRQCVLNQAEHTGENNSTPLLSTSPSDLQQKIKVYAAGRERRIEQFLEHVKTKHRTYLAQACPSE